MASRGWALVCVLVVASAVVALGQKPSGSTVASSILPDTQLPVLAKATPLGTYSKTAILHLAVSLKPKDAAGLQAFADSVSDPKSPNYRQYLTPKEIGLRFGASLADTTAVVNYLRSFGMKTTLVADNRMAILVDATVAQVESAFSTVVNTYKGPSPDGKEILTFHANATPVSIPPALANVILDVSGIEDYTRPKARNTNTLTPFLGSVLYNHKPAFTAGFRGEGRNVAISNFDGFRLANVPFFVSQFTLPTPAGGAGSNIQVIVAGTGAGSGTPQGEGDLDIQMALAMAPLANILIYDSTNLVTLLTKEANDNLADVISESYGWNIPAATATSAHNQHLAMTSQGITYMAATGDSGTTIEPFSYPNYDAEVLMVGGTVSTVDSTTGVRVSEVGWSGSGGGWSNNAATFNTLPSWQKGTGVPTNVNHRLSPDISLHASANSQTRGGWVFAFNGNGSFFEGDGTSFSSPVFAGCLTVVEQRLFQNSGRAAGTRWRLGRIQDIIYAMAGRPDVILDITSGANGNLPSGAASSCTAKWDFVTGWGVPNFDAFFRSFLGARP